MTNSKKAMRSKHESELSQGFTAVSLAARLAELKTDYDNQIRDLTSRITELEGGNTSEDNSKFAPNSRNRTKVVVLVHGIRDLALWQSEVRASLRSEGFEVALTNYGRFDLLRFLIPIPFFRSSVVKNVGDQIRSVKIRYPNADISVIAHSFGTYIISRVMSEEFDILFDRIIFCGGVYSRKTKFEQFSNRFLPPIINEIGTKDYWPALANSLTWGYGSAGTFGLRRPLFEDRWHKDAGHGHFLSREFCLRYWVPFLTSGQITGGEDSPKQPHRIIGLIEFVHIKYVVIVTLILSYFVYYNILW